MCKLPKIVVGLKQVGSLLHRIDILVASCFATIVVCVLMVMVHVAERESRVCW